MTPGNIILWCHKSILKIIFDDDVVVNFRMILLWSEMGLNNFCSPPPGGGGVLQASLPWCWDYTYSPGDTCRCGGREHEWKACVLKWSVDSMNLSKHASHVYLIAFSFVSLIICSPMKSKRWSWSSNVLRMWQIWVMRSSLSWSDPLTEDSVFFPLLTHPSHPHPSYMCCLSLWNTYHIFTSFSLGFLWFRNLL